MSHSNLNQSCYGMTEWHLSMSPCFEFNFLECIDCTAYVWRWQSKKYVFCVTIYLCIVFMRCMANESADKMAKVLFVFSIIGLCKQDLEWDMPWFKLKIEREQKRVDCYLIGNRIYCFCISLGKENLIVFSILCGNSKIFIFK